MKKWIVENRLMSIIVGILIYTICIYTFIFYLGIEVLDLPKKLVNIITSTLMCLGGFIIPYKINLLSGRDLNFEFIEKIAECSLPVIKKYLPKMIIYPFVITYGYKGLMYALKNNFDLTYSFVASYLSVIIFFLMLIEVLNRFMFYEYRGNPSQIYREDIKIDDRTITTKAYHEAGHFFVAKSLDLPIKEVNIINNGNTGGQLILDMPNILKPSQIKNMVMVKYAGYLAERILNSEASDGCMGCETSDIDSANILLRKYVLLTDDSISLTGYEEEYIKDKCIELSTLWKKEVEEMLMKNKENVHEIAEELIKNKVIKLSLKI
jgi:hypothetical protein